MINKKNDSNRELLKIDLVEKESFLYRNINKSKEKFYVKVEDDVVAIPKKEAENSDKHSLNKEVKEFMKTHRLPIQIGCTGTQANDGFANHDDVGYRAISNGLEKVIINGFKNGSQVLAKGLLDGTNKIACIGSTIALEDMEKLEDEVAIEYRNEAILLTNEDGLKSLRNIKDADGHSYLKKIYMNGKTNYIFDGRYVHVSKYYPIATNIGDALVTLVDLKKAPILLDGVAIKKDVSPERDGRVNKQYDMYFNMDILRENALATLIKK